MTQEQVAQVAGITATNVLRYEQGLYREPSEKILDVYSQRLELLDRQAVTRDYQAWRKAHRAELQLGSWQWSEPADNTVAPMRAWVKQVGIANSDIGLAIQLATHPVVTSNYLSGKTIRMPAELKEALNDIGMNDLDIYNMHKAHRKWYREQTERRFLARIGAGNAVK